MVVQALDLLVRVTLVLHRHLDDLGGDDIVGGIGQNDAHGDSGGHPNAPANQLADDETEQKGARHTDGHVDEHGHEDAQELLQRGGQPALADQGEEREGEQILAACLGEAVLIQKASHGADHADEQIHNGGRDAGDGREHAADAGEQSETREVGVGAVEEGGKTDGGLLLGSLRHCSRGELVLALGHITARLLIQAEGADGRAQKDLEADHAGDIQRKILTSGSHDGLCGDRTGDGAAGERRGAGIGHLAAEEDGAEGHAGDDAARRGAQGDQNGAPLPHKVGELEGGAEVGQHQSQTDRAGDLHHEVDLHQIGRKNMQNAAEDQKQDIDRENGRDDTLGFGGYVIADGERKRQHGKCHNGGPGDG